jgi:molecular chaperone DnaK
MYKATAATAGQGAQSTTGETAGAAAEPEQKKDEGVIDAEYVDVDEKK